MVKYARCNAILSLALDANGDACRYMSKADTEDVVLADMGKHMSSVHQVDPTDLEQNIRACTKTTRN